MTQIFAERSQKFSRALTPGEISLARSVFGSSIGYEKVLVKRYKWFVLQPQQTVMAPCGHLHFHPKSTLYHADFADSPIHLQGLFIHEMTHVWQAQQKGRWYLPIMRHPFCRYEYDLKVGKAFTQYGIEQQAEIVRHIFLYQQGIKPRGAAPLSCYQGLLPFSRKQD